MNLDKNALKTALSVSALLGHYGIDVPEEGRCICPLCGGLQSKLNAEISFDKVKCHACGIFYDIFNIVQNFSYCDFFPALTICAELAGLDGNTSPERMAELEAHRKELIARREHQAAQKEKYQKIVADTARKICAKAKQLPNHFEYYIKKKMNVQGLMSWNGWLIYPLYNKFGEVVNFQRISADGNQKLFLKYGEKQGCYFPLPSADGSHDGTLYIAEGLSTADAINQATGQETIVALDAGNLAPVAMLMREKFPHREIVIVGDNDEYPAYTRKKNRGTETAIFAAQQAQCKVVVPKLAKGGKADANDIYCQEGVESLRKQLETATEPPPKVSIAVECPAQEEPPAPLQTETIAPQEFPLECLGERLAHVAQSVSTGTGINIGAVAATMLAVLSLCSQGLANVVLNGRVTPLSLFLMILAKSGSGKTTLDTILTKAIRNFERSHRPEHENKLSEWNLETRAYFAEVKKIERSNMLYEEKKQALKALGEPPKKPREPRFLYANATIQGLFKRFRDAMPSLGLFADEGTTVIGGHSMKAENRIGTIGFYSDIWSTGRADKTVSGEDGSSFVEGIRLTMSVMLQHIIALPLFADAVLMAQGILARFLVTEIPSTPKQYTEFDTENNEHLQYFYNICTQLLNIDLQYNKTGGLIFRELHVKPEAKAVYIEFFNRLEVLVTDDKALASIHPFGKRGAEQALRIAGILTLAENPSATHIEAQTMANAVQIALWFLSETLRITGMSETDMATADAERVLAYLKEKNATETTDRQLQRESPVRNKSRLQAAIKVLLEHGHLKRMKKGSVVTGKGTDQGLKVVLS